MSISIISRNWLLQLQKYNRLLVGFSGGLDSTVLLHALSMENSIKKKLIAVHVNYNIHSNSNIWEIHCKNFCKSKNIPLFVKKIRLCSMSNIECNARNIRYKLFSSLINYKEAILLAHHCNDQAETLLLQLFRGAGINGLSAMQEKRIFFKGYLLRPLLRYEKIKLNNYAKFYDLTWINDISNNNIKFSRNYIRNILLPSISLRWPNIVKTLYKTSERCKEANINLDNLAKIDCPTLTIHKTNCLPTLPLLNFSIFRIKNILASWFKIHNIYSPNSNIINNLSKNIICLKNGNKILLNLKQYSILYYRNVIFLRNNLKNINNNHSIFSWIHFPNPLLIKNLNTKIEVIKNTTFGIYIPNNSIIEVRFRCSGEKIKLHGKTKKLKKLFQQWKIEPWNRKNIPLLYINGKLACIIGYAIHDDFYSHDTKNIFLFKIISIK